MATNPRGEMKSYSLVKALVYGGQNEAVDNNLFKSGSGRAPHALPGLRTRNATGVWRQLKKSPFA